MITQYFEAPHVLRRLRAGSTGPYVDGYAEHLRTQGYSRLTTRGFLRAAAHLGRWADHAKVSVNQLGEHALPGFSAHLRVCRCIKTSHGLFADHLAGARHFLDFLRMAGVLSVPASKLADRPVLLAEYRSWMVANRGLAQSSLDLYERALAPFIVRYGEDPALYTVGIVREFVVKYAAKHGLVHAKTASTALRSLLRFLSVEGRCPTDLVLAVPTIPRWRLSSLPKYLDSDIVTLALDSCDLTTPSGLRDRAILLLLSRLGFRAQDVVLLCLGDVDWLQGTIVVRGKGRRDTLLPLPQDVGDAVLSYIERGRPLSPDDRVFLRARAPVRPFATSAGIADVVKAALRRAGCKDLASTGSHVMRHSAATAMLRAGSSLETIAAVLRHQSIETTEIYAKVDTGLLGAIAQPWPEVAPC
jgi:integrase/recombinase XerD